MVFTKVFSVLALMLVASAAPQFPLTSYETPLYPDFARIAPKTLPLTTPYFPLTKYVTPAATYGLPATRIVAPPPPPAPVAPHFAPVPIPTYPTTIPAPPPPPAPVAPHFAPVPIPTYPTTFPAPPPPTPVLGRLGFPPVPVPEPVPAPLPVPVSEPRYIPAPVYGLPPTRVLV